jgi:hypothetical protein
LIHHEITHPKFQAPRPSADTATLGPDEWAILATLCDDDPMYLELVAKLLDTERSNGAVQKACEPEGVTLEPTNFLGANPEPPHRHLQSSTNLL